MQAPVNEKLILTYPHPLQGENLPSTSLAGVLQSAPYLWLQFLRHLGCIYCKGLVQDIFAFMERWNGHKRPHLIFVHPNTVEEGRRFFADFYPEASFIADPELRLYRLFGVRRASILSQARLSNLLRFWNLLQRGLTNDRPTGDPWVLHASFLFREGKLVWSYYAKTFSDVPEWKKLL